MKTFKNSYATRMFKVLLVYQDMTVVNLLLLSLIRGVIPGVKVMVSNLLRP